MAVMVQIGAGTLTAGNPVRLVDQLIESVEHDDELRGRGEGLVGAALLHHEEPLAVGLEARPALLEQVPGEVLQRLM
jgi:hypothetical protein